MLVITRKENESFTIGDNITVTLGKKRGNQIRVIIDAPKHLLIKRTEQSKDSDNNTKDITIAQAIKWRLL